VTDYLKKRFTVAVGAESYRDNWERILRGTPSTPLHEKPAPGPVVIENLSREELLVELRETQTALQDAMERIMRLTQRVRELEAAGAR